jgi:hypothetical protein
VSLMTSKNQAKARAGAGWNRARRTVTRVTPLARDAGTRVVPLARDAGTRVAPLAKTAGTTAVQGVQDARDWAAPRIEQGVNQARDWAAPRIEQGVNQARGWAAPRIEHAAQAVEETVAPKVSEALTAAARRIEPPGKARRRWPRLLAALAVAGAACGVVAVIVRRRAAGAPDIMETDEDVVQDTPGRDVTTDGETVLADADIAGNGQRGQD